MALIHTDAELQPGKLELLSGWVPRQPWGHDEPLVREATFRFDDPAGEVGLETFLLRSGVVLLHVPLTYRGAPLEDGELVGEMEHSTLGHRWVYDGPSDPVWVQVVTEVIVGAGQEAAQVAADGTALPRSPASASVRGSGGPAGGRWQGRLEVLRRVPAPAGPADGTLSAIWGERPEPVELVRLSAG